MQISRTAVAPRDGTLSVRALPAILVETDTHGRREPLDRERSALRGGAPARSLDGAPPRGRARRRRVPGVPALPHGAPPRRPDLAAGDRRRPVRLHVGG